MLAVSHKFMKKHLNKTPIKLASIFHSPVPKINTNLSSTLTVHQTSESAINQSKKQDNITLLSNAMNGDEVSSSVYGFFG